MVKQIVFLVILGLVAIKTVNAVHCYVCYNCSDKKSYEGQSQLCSTDTFEPVITTPAVTTTDETRAGKNDDTTTTEETINPTTPVDTDYRCVKYKFNGQISRACTKKPCRVIQEKGKITECNLCENDNCNPGSIAKSWAIRSIMLVVAVKFLF